MQTLRQSAQQPRCSTYGAGRRSRCRRLAVAASKVGVVDLRRVAEQAAAAGAKVGERAAAAVRATLPLLPDAAHAAALVQQHTRCCSDAAAHTHAVLSCSSALSASTTHPSLGAHADAACSQVVTEALDKPRSITSKGSIGDIVTETGARVAPAYCAALLAALLAPTRTCDMLHADKASEAACIAAITAAFADHAILGEESGISGNKGSDYLWVIDPLDGTCNFAHNYPGFCVSIGVLRHALPVAGCVIEFTGASSDARTGGCLPTGGTLRVCCLLHVHSSDCCVLAWLCRRAWQVVNAHVQRGQKPWLNGGRATLAGQQRQEA